MSSVDRIQKFAEDQTLLVSSTKHAKIKSEIRSLSSWLVKHQNESIPDSSKGKIFTMLEVVIT